PSDIESEKSILKAKDILVFGEEEPIFCRWRGKAHREGEPKAHVLIKTFCSIASVTVLLKSLG
uniref:hypothetical protein n=1 Tax=unclassified Bartonella TaxID=2645622 RepID=UPI0035CE9681